MLAVQAKMSLMESIILTRISEKEMYEESFVLKRFEAAFLGRDMEMLDELLDDKGNFFNHMSKGSVLASFYRYFKETRSIDKIMHTVVNKGFTSDHKPCQPVLEFRFPDYDPFSGNRVDLDRPLCAKPNAARYEVVYRFAFTIRGKKVVGMRFPSVCKESLEREIKMN
jgi:hypothetical protein